MRNMKWMALAVLTLVCTYQVRSDTMLCASYLLNDRSDCYDTASFEADIGSEDMAANLAECLSEANSDAAACRAAVDRSCLSAQ